VKASQTGLLASAVLLAMTMGLAPGAPGAHPFAPAMVYAQDATPRTVSGAVLDDSDQPVVGATVFLKNVKTKSIRSFTSVEKGHYYFAQVSKMEDFELWAEKGDKKTAVKTISSWDSRAKFVTDLKMK
jgi:hypothetical protein